MGLTKNQKIEIAQKYQKHEGDTGSAEVQIAMLTARIQQLTEHLKNNPQDQHSRVGLLKLVGARRRHLKYLARKNEQSYQNLLQSLGLRR